MICVFFFGFFVRYSPLSFGGYEGEYHLIHYNLAFRDSSNI